MWCLLYFSHDDAFLPPLLGCIYHFFNKIYDHSAPFFTLVFWPSIVLSYRYCAGWFFAYDDTLASESVPPCLCLLVDLSLLLVPEAPKKRNVDGVKNFLHLPRMSLDSCMAPTIKWLCAIFYHGGMSDK